MNIKEKQIGFWFEKCKKNIEFFKLNYNNMSKERRISFIKQQFQLIRIINKVLDGTTQLHGVNLDNFNQGKSKNE